MAERIAVIAIHGVGDHLPFDMARSVGNMLENLRDPVNVSAMNAPGKPRYCTFGQSTIRLNVAPVKVLGHAADAASRGKTASGKPAVSRGPMDRLLASQVPVKRATEASVMSVDHLFMEGQLENYIGEGPEDTYEVLRLEGNRYKDAPVGPQHQSQPLGARAERTPGKKVHIYDMFWSDLSGLNNAGLRIFGELYQVLFHLGSIGVNNVKAAAVLFQKEDSRMAARWKQFSSAQSLPAAILAMPLPFLNLILFALTLTLFAVAALRRVSPAIEIVTITGVILAAAAAFLGFATIRRGRFDTWTYRTPLVIALLLLGGAAALSQWVSPTDSEVLRRAAGIVSTAVILPSLLYGIRVIVRSYENMKPDATKVFNIVLIVSVPATILIAALPPYLPEFLEMQILLRAIEAGFWLLMLCWFCFWVALVWAFIAGARAVSATKKDRAEETDRARNTNWTARLTVALPALFFLLLTFAFWTGTMKLGLGLLPHDEINGACLSGKELCYYSHLLGNKNLEPIADWADGALFLLGGLYLPILLLIATLAGIITMWAVAPSIASEMSPPRGTLGDLAAQSEPLGDWLTRGFEFMRWGGRLIYVGIFLFPLTIAFFLSSRPLYVSVGRLSAPVSHALGVLVAGAALGLFSFGGRLSKLALGLRPLVRVALDVDNWLREHPLDRNPTARICGRYVSLLRYICQWRDGDGNGYDAIVIFAHSQGTVITADLLRFLHSEACAASSYRAYDETLAALDGQTMPIHLFTMGCPLRQLYALRFPYLYDYVGPAGSKLPNGPAPSPSPADLGIIEWVNAYRTGDYVGRFLWRDKPWVPVADFSPGDWNPAASMPANVYHEGGRVEFSIGPGAHTHYWDSTAGPIAQMLDVLIAHA